MNDLATQEVNCEGINMIACQTQDGKIHVGIRSICDGLGVDYNGQMQRISRDDVLPKGVCKIQTPSAGGEQEANMLDISYLPFFLIGIKSNMVRAEVAPRIVEFKLKAKDVLAAAFLPNEKEGQDPYAGLSPEVRAIFVHDKKIQAVETRMDKLENIMTVDYSQQQTLQSIANKTVITCLCGKESGAYKQMSKKVFSAIWHTYKAHFGVSSYRDTPTAKFEDAKNYLSNWVPDYNLSLEIGDANRVTCF